MEGRGRAGVQGKVESTFVWREGQRANSKEPAGDSATCICFRFIDAKGTRVRGAIARGGVLWSSLL
jgi:hypothetical protein